MIETAYTSLLTTNQKAAGSSPAGHFRRQCGISRDSRITTSFSDAHKTWRTPSTPTGTPTRHIQRLTRRNTQYENVAYLRGFLNNGKRPETTLSSLTRRRSLVRTQHRPLRKSGVLQVKRRTSKRTQGYACRPSYCNCTATRAEPAHQTVPNAASIALVAESCMSGRTATGRGDIAGTCQEQLRKGYFVSVVALSCSL